MNRALLWKDIQLLKETLVSAAALILFSYLVAGALVYSGDYAEFSWAKVVAGGASLVRFTSILICALIGGHIYGREREESSSEYLDRLPAKRFDIMRSKLIVAAATVGFVWALSLSLLALGIVGMGSDFGIVLRVFEAMLGFIAAGATAFGTAWVASFFIGSPVAASFAGLTILTPVVALQAGANTYFSIESRAFFDWTAVACMLAYSVVCVVLAFRLYGGRTANGSKVSMYGFHRVNPECAWSTDTIPVFRKPSVLGALIWKDLQLAKTSIGAGVLLIAAPYLIVAVGLGLTESASVSFRAASVISAALTCIATAFWAGQITTAEHAAKTVAFSSYLPISRRTARITGFLVTFLPGASCIVLNLACLIISNNSVHGAPPFDNSFTWDNWNRNGFIVMGFALANAALLTFSTAWILGTRLMLPALAIVGGILALPLCVLAWASVSSSISLAGNDITPLQFVVGFSGVALVLSSGLIHVSKHLESRTDMS